MRGVKSEFRLLDLLFRRENEQNQQQLQIIAASYEAAQSQDIESATLAARRYRKGEHRFATCRHMHISESQYYKLLSKFLATAKAVHDKILAAE